MHYYPGTVYTRSGSDSGLHRRNYRRDPEPFDSGDSTLSELDESESGSGSGIDVDPNLPYPGIAPTALRYLSQTTRPRSWCLALISNPYPLHNMHIRFVLFTVSVELCKVCIRYIHTNTYTYTEVELF